MFFIRRFILPVGQGAFYVERINDINIVYDCGSTDNQAKIPSLIKECFARKKTIEAVFISHLDKDHINGVEELLKNCEVKRICFPLITEEMKKVLEIKIMFEEAMGNRYSQFTKEFIENPEETVKKIIKDKEIELIEILPDDWDKKNDNKIDKNDNKIDKEIIKNSKIKRYREKSGENIAKKIKDLNGWELIPYNFRQEIRINELKENLEKEFKEEIHLEKVEEIWKEGGEKKAKIKRAYIGVSGDLNTNSMTLFLGIREDKKEISLEKAEEVSKNNEDSEKKETDYNDCYIKKGCLYTGDYDVNGKQKWEKLEKAYQEYWKWIGFIQVPHHGSSKNCNDNLISKNAVYFLSAGRNNGYKHPSKDVVHDITLKYGNNLYIVTEDKGLEVILDSKIKIYNIFSSFSKTIENNQGDRLEIYIKALYLRLNL